jgi:hypothetical protein
MILCRQRFASLELLRSQPHRAAQRPRPAAQHALAQPQRVRGVGTGWAGGHRGPPGIFFRENMGKRMKTWFFTMNMGNSTMLNS